MSATRYDEWGNQVWRDGYDINQLNRTLDNNRTFTGHLYDTVMNMYHAEYRMYDPENHRFTQQDPILDGLNWYIYVGNNPVNYVDPLGLRVERKNLDETIEAFGGTVKYSVTKEKFGTVTRATAYLGGKTKSFYVYPENGYYHRMKKCNDNIMVNGGMLVDARQLMGFAKDYYFNSQQYRDSMSLLLGFTPGAGDLKDIQEAVTGFDIVTGDKLSVTDRGITVVAAVLPVVSGKAVRVTIDLEKVASKEVKEALEEAAGKAAKNADNVAKFTNKQIDDYIKLATHNNNAPNVTLGKWEDGPSSYVNIAKKRGDAYFDLGTDGWDNASKLVNGNRDEMWRINQRFLDNQILKGKNFNLTHDPFNADGFYNSEIKYLLENGYNITKEGGCWRATK